ncbi:MAG: HPr family phosphocarrier protein [Candidatus Omnitrophota bacterium]|nr:MAG: HPr family phosphocarrier protein [Candidatus Omnitrophota bacterium]
MDLIKEPFKPLKVPVKPKYSLTGRWAAVFVQIANLFKDTKIHLIKPPIKINAKSIIAILNLYCQAGETLFIEAQGQRRNLAIVSLIKALSDPTGETAKNILHNLKNTLKPASQKSTPLPLNLGNWLEMRG